MKKRGSISDFTVLRDQELLASFRQELMENRGGSLDELFVRAVHRPASRFWVSELRAAEVISAMLRGEAPDNQLPKRREMYEEILRRVVEWQRGNPGRPLSDAVAEVVNSPAPEFYLSDLSAKVIIYRVRRAARDKRRSGDGD